MNCIDTFYVLDFDRCLGNVDASFKLLKKVVHELSIINEQSFQLARDTAENKGLSFSALEYITNFDESVDINIVENLFIKYAINENIDLLETGAVELLEGLRISNNYFCIMSYGENRWQTLKIKASGLIDIPNIIVDSRKKCRYISKWKDEKTGKFTIPCECFIDGVSRIAAKIVIVDDKLVAFDGMPDGARGYWINKDHVYSVKNSIPKSVITVKYVNEIICKESL